MMTTSRRRGKAPTSSRGTRLSRALALAVTLVLAVTTLGAVAIREFDKEDVLTFETLDASFDRFKELESKGLIDPAALPAYDLGSEGATVPVYQPPIESLIARTEGTGIINDPSTATTLVLYETLKNQDRYGKELAQLANAFAYISGFPEFNADFQLELLKTGLPSISDTVVRAWQTDFVVDMFQIIKEKLNERLPELRQVFDSTNSPDISKDKKNDMVVDLMVEVALQIMQDPESQMWADLTAILGDPLGPALVPVLNSSLAESAMEDPQGIESRAEEKREEILETIQTLAGKIILFNPYFPSPCLKDTSYCSEDFQKTSEELELQDLYRKAQEDPDFADDDFSSDLRKRCVFSPLLSPSSPLSTCS